MLGVCCLDTPRCIEMLVKFKIITMCLILSIIKIYSQFPSIFYRICSNDVREEFLKSSLIYRFHTLINLT